MRRRIFPGSAVYWDRRYRLGGTSGPGSYGEHARFKADVLNDFVASRSIADVVEFGCGDGNQLALAAYPDYLGLDVSRDAIARCTETFRDDPTKRFRPYDSALFAEVGIADMALSLDVILHLVEDGIFELHVKHLFQSARRNVIIYGSDVDLDRTETAAHVRFRRFLPHIEERFPDWSLVQVIEGIAPAADGPRTDFFVFQLD